jgi:hypothetical protein
MKSWVRVRKMEKHSNKTIQRILQFILYLQQLNKYFCVTGETIA